MLFVVTLRGSQRREERQRPHPRSPRDLRQQRYAYPPQGARFDEMGVAGSNRIPVDALRFLPRPDGTAQHPMVAEEAPLILQAYRPRGGGHGSLARSEDRARHEQ